jgi:hypothetical protein
MPNSIGMAATRGTLHRGATKFGGTWLFGVQCRGLPFLGDRSSSLTAAPLPGLLAGREGRGDWVHGLWLVGFSQPDVARWSGASG